MLDHTDPDALIIETARRFAQERLAPTASAREAAGRIEPEVIAELGEMGFLGATNSSDYGGSEISYETYAQVIEEIAAGDGSVSTLVSVHNAPTCEILERFGSPAQKEQWLRPMASGVVVASFALTESCAGSDASGVRTRAVRTNSGYVVNGSKQFISNASVGKTTILFAVTDPAAGKVRALLALDALVLFSTHNEGMPLSLIEGMAAGLPWIATDRGGTRELAGSPDDCLVVAVPTVDLPAQARAFADRILAGTTSRRRQRAQDLHGGEVLQREGSRVQQLHRRQRREVRRGRRDAPAQHRRARRTRRQPRRAEPLHEAAAPNEQRDLGDDGLRDQQADHRVRDAVGAPVKRRERVVGGVRALDQRGGEQGQPERGQAQQLDDARGARRGGRPVHGRQQQREAGGEAVAGRLGRINNIEMALTVEIGRTRMSVRDVLSLEPGKIIELDRSAGAPADVLLNGRLIAHGEVVVLDQDYAVRITRILDVAEGLS